MSRFYVSLKEASRGHAGLLLDKYLLLDKDLDPDKPEWRGPEWGEFAGLKLDDTVYRLAYQRWENCWRDGAPKGRLVMKGRVSGRLAVGVGAKGVLEVGLRLQHAYGTPVIPGSAIKGVLSHAAVGAEWRGFLFGSEESQGFVQFQDAWWVPENKSPLVMDVMTVHHGDYYISGSKPPSDCDNPNPVPFLSVRGAFLFVADTPNAEWRGYVEKLLKQTLEQRGVGAKTAAGYGRFMFGG